MSFLAGRKNFTAFRLTFELTLLLEVPEEADVDDERHDGRQRDAEADEDGEALAEGDRVLALLLVCQVGKFRVRLSHCAQRPRTIQ